MPVLIYLFLAPCSVFYAEAMKPIELFFFEPLRYIQCHSGIKAPELKWKENNQIAFKG